MDGQRSAKDAVTLQANETNIDRGTDVQGAFPGILHILLAAVVIVLVLVLAMIARWIYRKRKYNRLRHFLIPTYTFDPNEEETWDTGIDSRESAIIAGSYPQSYQSMEAKNNVGGGSTTNK